MKWHVPQALYVHDAHVKELPHAHQTPIAHLRPIPPQCLSFGAMGVHDALRCRRQRDIGAVNEILKRLEDEAKAIDVLIPGAPDQSGRA
jgi:hypothetical protein